MILMAFMSEDGCDLKVSFINRKGTWPLGEVLFCQMV